ncbi:MAG: PilZ domain-containing protein [SAR324 cluster bacterium]|nr:PilZ domain-containing protein [SAR324 cluster bacterium]
MAFPATSTLVAGGKGQTTQLVDLSIRGALVEEPAEWALPNGSRCELELRLTDSDVVISMAMEVAYSKEGRVGLRCLSIDLESITHLRRLLELNLGDPQLVERELLQLG